MSTITHNSPDKIWGMKVAEGGGGGDFTPCPTGNYPARIVAIFDIGHQTEDKTSNVVDPVTKVTTKVVSKADVRKLILLFELTKKQPDATPYVLPLRLTWSMNEQANLYKYVVSITGEKFAAGQDFDPRTLLGKVVMANITAGKPNDKGKVYTNISTLAQYPEGMPEPTFQYELLLWSVLERKPFPNADWLPYVYGKPIETLVKESTEYRDAVDRNAPTAPRNEEANQEGDETGEETIPF